METVTSTLTVVIYAVVCLSLGLRLTSFFVPQQEFSKHSRWVMVICTSFLLGQGVMAAVWQLVALAGQFTIPIVTVLCLVSLASGATLLPALFTPVSWTVRQELRDWWNETTLWKIAVFLIVVSFCITAVHTFLPPMPRGDALAFYMSYPRLIAATGDLSVAPTTYFYFLQVGLQGELHYALLMLFGNMLNPDLFALLTLIAGAGLLIALAEIAGLQQRGKWIIFIGMMTSSAVTIIVWDGKVDIFGAAIGVAAYYWAFRVNDDESGSVNYAGLGLSGLFTGLAIIAKISYAVFLPLTIALIIGWRFYLSSKDTNSPQQIIMTLVRIGLILAFWGALPAIPHVIKNAVLFDAPLAPVISQNNEAFVEQSWFNAQTTNRILVTYPFALTFGDFWGQGGQLTPLVLAFSPFLLILFKVDHKKRRILIQIGTLALIAIGIWAIFRASVFAPRYMLSPLLLLLIPVAFVAEKVSLLSSRRSLAILVPIALMIVTAIFIAQDITLTRFSLNLALGRVDECTYEYTNSDGSCRIAQVINNETEVGASVMRLSYYSYWLRPDLAQCSVGDVSVPPPYLWEHIHRHQIKYVMVDTLTHQQQYTQLIANVPEWATLEPFFDESTYLGFRVQTDLPADVELFSCTDQGGNIWENTLDFSATVAGQVPEAPHGFQVEDNTLTWDASEVAEWYQIWISPSNPEIDPVMGWYSAEDLGCNAGQTCLFEHTLPSGNYQWYVRAWASTGLNAGGLQGWITAPAFTLLTHDEAVESEG